MTRMLGAHVAYGLWSTLLLAALIGFCLCAVAWSRCRALSPVGRPNFGDTHPTKCILAKGEDTVEAGPESDDFQ